MFHCICHLPSAICHLLFGLGGLGQDIGNTLSSRGWGPDTTILEMPVPSTFVIWHSFGIWSRACGIIRLPAEAAFQTAVVLLTKAVERRRVIPPPSPSNHCDTLNLAAGVSIYNPIYIGKVQPFSLTLKVGWMPPQPPHLSFIGPLHPSLALELDSSFATCLKRTGADPHA